MTLEEKAKEICPDKTLRDKNGMIKWCPVAYGLLDSCTDGTGDCEKCWSKEFIQENDTKSDPVNRPSHYTTGNIECIDAIKASMSPDEYAGFLKGNAIKYIWRYRHKGKMVEDLKKAEWYLGRLRRFTELETAKNG